jgi:hypothetical protein
MNVVLKFMPNLSFLRWANELLYLRGKFPLLNFNSIQYWV